MSLGLLIVLAFGVLLMCIPIGLQMKWYRILWWKSILISVTLALIGVVGSYLWFYVENGYFWGRSLFGSIFFAPLAYYPIAKIIKIPYHYSLDFCAPAGALTLAAIKLQCLRDGCCQGMILGIDQNYFYVRFPSQIVESVAFALVGIVLLVLSKKPKYRGKIFPWFLILYGSTRFVLDFFRDISASYALGLSSGSFWSLCAIIVGVMWLHLLIRKNAATMKQE